MADKKQNHEFRVELRKEYTDGRNPLPLREDGTHDKEKIRELFFASEYVEWAPFCEEMGWDSTFTRKELPTRHWIMEKRRMLAENSAEITADLIFKHRNRWKNDILKTMRDYPEVNDQILQTIKFEIANIIKHINADIEQGKKDGKLVGIDKDRINAINQLSYSASLVTNTKYTALLIKNWDVKIVEQFMESTIDKIDDEKAEQDKKWVVEVIGAGPTQKEIQATLNNYKYDSPRNTMLDKFVEEDDADD